jgi:hypothetical protein
LSTGHVALDMDVFPMDNSGTDKDGVSRTYKGHDGYAPIAGYLGQEGRCIACELCEGKQHSRSEFVYVLERTTPYARQLTDKPLLVRLDSGHDAGENRAWLSEEGIESLYPKRAANEAQVQSSLPRFSGVSAGLPTVGLRITARDAGEVDRAAFATGLVRP